MSYKLLALLCVLGVVCSLLLIALTAAIVFYPIIDPPVNVCPDYPIQDCPVTECIRVQCPRCECPRFTQTECPPPRECHTPDCPVCPPGITPQVTDNLFKLMPESTGSMAYAGGYAAAKKDCLCEVGLREGCRGGGLLQRINYTQVDEDFFKEHLCYPSNETYLSPDDWIIEVWGSYGGIKLTRRNISSAHTIYGG